MYVLQTIAPILILIALGAVLAHIRFLGPQFIADLNKLVFWIALPVLIFRDVSQATTPDSETARIFLVLLGVTFLAIALGWIGAKVLKLPPAGMGSIMQAAYRGNLAYIGIPVLQYSFANIPAADRQQPLATALLVMALLSAVYNILAVIILQAPQHRLSIASFAAACRNILLNPLIIACVAGFLFSRFSLTVPSFLDQTLHTLGQVAVPVALLCIGGSLIMTSLHGRTLAVITGSIIKVGICPLLAWILGKALGITGLDFRLLLIFAACPTAVASYSMAKQNQADETMASGMVALSTVFSVVSLSVVLWLA